MNAVKELISRWNREAAWDIAGACGEIQGARIMREKGQDFFFLPMFGFADPEAVPTLPSNYGLAGL